MTIEEIYRLAITYRSAQNGQDKTHTEIEHIALDMLKEKMNKRDFLFEGMTIPEGWHRRPKAEK